MKVIGKWINDAAEQLDLMKLQSLIDAIRRRDDGSSGSEGALAKPGDYPPYQGVKEPTPVYCM